MALQKIDSEDRLKGMQLYLAAKVSDENAARQKAEIELAIAKYKASVQKSKKAIDEWLTFAESVAKKFSVPADKVDWDEGTVEVPEAA